VCHLGRKQVDVFVGTVLSDGFHDVVGALDPVATWMMDPYNDEYTTYIQCLDNLLKHCQTKGVT
jgi:hypothetical protein